MPASKRYFADPDSAAIQQLRTSTGPQANAGNFYDSVNTALAPKVDFSPMIQGVNAAQNTMEKFARLDAKFYAENLQMEGQLYWKDRLSRGDLTPEKFDKEFAAYRKTVDKQMGMMPFAGEMVGSVMNDMQQRFGSSVIALEAQRRNVARIEALKTQQSMVLSQMTDKTIPIEQLKSSFSNVTGNFDMAHSAGAISSGAHRASKLMNVTGWTNGLMERYTTHPDLGIQEYEQHKGVYPFLDAKQSQQIYAKAIEMGARNDMAGKSSTEMLAVLNAYEAKLGPIRDDKEIGIRNKLEAIMKSNEKEMLVDAAGYFGNDPEVLRLRKNSENLSKLAGENPNDPNLKGMAQFALTDWQNALLEKQKFLKPEFQALLSASERKAASQEFQKALNDADVKPESIVDMVIKFKASHGAMADRAFDELSRDKSIDLPKGIQMMAQINSNEKVNPGYKSQLVDIASAYSPKAINEELPSEAEVVKNLKKQLGFIGADSTKVLPDIIENKNLKSLMKTFDRTEDGQKETMKSLGSFVNRLAIHYISTGKADDAETAVNKAVNVIQSKYNIIDGVRFSKENAETRSIADVDTAKMLIAQGLKGKQIEAGSVKIEDSTLFEKANQLEQERGGIKKLPRISLFGEGTNTPLERIVEFGKDIQDYARAYASDTSVMRNPIKLESFEYPDGKIGIAAKVRVGTGGEYKFLEEIQEVVNPDGTKTVKKVPVEFREEDLFKQVDDYRQSLKAKAPEGDAAMFMNKGVVAK